MFPIYIIYKNLQLISTELFLIFLNQRLQVINSMNKENISTNRTATSQNKKHPSDESSFQHHRSTIRVGYSVTKINNSKCSGRPIFKQKTINQEQMPLRYHKKRTEPSIQQVCKQDVLRKCQNRELKSGIFVNSEYVKDGKNQPMFHKKGVVQAHEKYQSGHNVKYNIENQLPSKKCNESKQRRCSSMSSINAASSRSKVLPSYQETGIKNVMQYNYAGKYKDIKVTQKCTKASALSRFCQFDDLHDYDFRKRPIFLR